MTLKEFILAIDGYMEKNGIEKKPPQLTKKEVMDLFAQYEKKK